MKTAPTTDPLRPALFYTFDPLARELALLRVRRDRQRRAAQELQAALIEARTSALG